MRDANKPIFENLLLLVGGLNLDGGITAAFIEEISASLITQIKEDEAVRSIALLRTLTKLMLSSSAHLVANRDLFSEIISLAD